MDAQADLGEVCGPYCNVETNKRLLEFAIFNNLVLTNTHDLVMITFRIRLKKTRKPNQPRLRFDLEMLRDPDVACTFQAKIGGNFASLIGLRD